MNSGPSKLNRLLAGTGAVAGDALLKLNGLLAGAGAGAGDALLELNGLLAGVLGELKKLVKGGAVLAPA